MLAVACGDGIEGASGTTGVGKTTSSDGVSETGAGGPTGATTNDGPTGATTTTGDAPTSTTTSGDDTSGSMTSFGVPFDVASDRPVVCDLWEQDCPEGQKCAVWADGGGSAWNATKCVPVAGDRLPGEPCMAESGVSGLDDCIKGAMCWDVDARGQGVCLAYCVGTREMPACTEPGFGCAYIGEVFNLCFPACDPLGQDCEAEGLCLPVSGTYLCTPDNSGDAGAVFDPCEFANACDKGLICLGPDAADECDQGETGCCRPMCSIAEGGAAWPGAGQDCLAVYEPQPPGYEDVGYCSLAP
jgi:hypothetical protein